MFHFAVGYFAKVDKRGYNDTLRYKKYLQAQMANALCLEDIAPKRFSNLYVVLDRCRFFSFASFATPINCLR